MGSLVVVGTGISSVAHTTLEAKSHMETADKLLYVVADPITETWLERLNENAESLKDCYQDGQHRGMAYQRMADRILEWVRKDKTRVCAAFYGHPGIFVRPSHAAVEQARQEGFEARMLPGISAEDCLFADLGFDPAVRGCQTFEATDFLLRRPRFDPACHVILWQIGVVGDPTYSSEGSYREDGLPVLREELLEHYPADHEIVVYAASQFTIAKPIIIRLPLRELGTSPIPGIATLYIPPFGTWDIDPEMVRRLGMEENPKLDR